MTDDMEVEIYQKLAVEAIEHVFNVEFNHSLGLPFPDVKILLPDEEHYKTGEYYISIGDNWQIHLFFGELPVSYKDFQDEVKVLARHEIGHYMCCPYDVLTHLRMVKAVMNVYDRSYRSLGIDIRNIAGAITNEIADIIVDTHNFRMFPDDTLKSEINWIKKNGGLAHATDSQKLLFLTKEMLWGESLDINEKNKGLLRTVNDLTADFNGWGMEDRSHFLRLTERYAKTYFDLLQHDRQQSQKNVNEAGSDAGGVKMKDASSGTALVYMDSDQVRNALNILAQETSLQSFCNIVNAVGGCGLGDKEKRQLWLTIKSAKMLPIVEFDNHSQEESYSYPATWQLGDPVEQMDMMLTFMGSPRFIPGITSKKWEKSNQASMGKEKKQRDLLLVIDTSSSMGGADQESSNMHQALLAAYGIVAYFEKSNSDVALIGFSDRITIDCTWTKDYDAIRNALLTDGHGSTFFPINKIKEVLSDEKRSFVTVLITDGALQNKGESVNFFRRYILEDNKLYILVLGNESMAQSFSGLSDIGASVWNSTNAEGFCKYVINEVTE